MRIPLLVDGNSRALVFYYIGNGSATFDPEITTSKSITIIWQTSDGQNVTTTGTSHAFSYTPASGGPHRCTARVNGGLGLVTAIDANTDAITEIKNIQRCVALTNLTAYTNAALVLRLPSLPPTLTYLQGTGTLANGSPAGLPALASLYLAGCSSAAFPLSAISRVATTIRLELSTGVYGPLTDLPATAQTCWLYSDILITPGSVGHLTAIRDIRIYSMWPSLSAAASVDIVINSMWAARANYTYATPSLQIGGTNPAPTGNYIAPEEGSDWHNDGSKWIPLTPNAKVYDLVNDVNTEGFNTWTITTS